MANQTKTSSLWDRRLRFCGRYSMRMSSGCWTLLRPRQILLSSQNLHKVLAQCTVLVTIWLKARLNKDPDCHHKKDMRTEEGNHSSSKFEQRSIAWHLGFLISSLSVNQLNGNWAAQRNASCGLWQLDNVVWCHNNSALDLGIDTKEALAE